MKDILITVTAVILTIVVTVCIMTGTIAAVYLNSNIFYAKKLTTAIQEEDIPAIEQILEKKPTCINAFPSPAPKWFYPLMGTASYPLNQACATDNIELIELLIKNGADVNCNDGLTPLSTVYRGKAQNWYDISLLLIENGASLDYTTHDSDTYAAILYDIAFEKTSPEQEPANEEEVYTAFFYALEHCNHAKVNWFWVLQTCVSHDRIALVQYLLDNHYSYVDCAPPYGGVSPLMFAARDSNAEMVQLLLDYGADKSFKDENGKTAYDYALQSENTEALSLLLPESTAP